MCSYESDILIKIFINCIDKFERLDNIKSLKFDYSIKIIFDILLSKDDIYNKSLRNLFILDGNSLQQFLNPKEILKKKHIQNNVELIFPLINDLSIVNRAYSHYDIDYSTYVKNVNSILKSLKELIQNFILGFEIDMSTKSNKFYLNIIKRKDFENQAIFNFQISIRYTQFYQTLFELLSNYKEVLNFYSNDDKYKIPLIETELLKFVLKLLYLSFENNDENFSLILIFDSELLIKIFIQFDKEFHLFLKILSYNFFKKIDSVNFSIIENKYFSNLMNNLILSIDKEPDINFQIKWLKRIIKILEKNIKYINNSSSYLINTFQYVFLIIKNLNVKLFQSNDEERDSIYIPIQDQIDSEDFEDKDEFEKEVIRKDIRDNKNNILAFIKFFKECSKKCLQKNTNEDLILSLFDGYLNLLNMIIFNGLYCLNIFEYYFSPEVELFEKIIKNPNDNDISSKLELHLTRYIQLITFYPNFQIGKESDDIHQKMYLSNSEFYHKFHEIYQSKYTFNQIQNMLCNPNFIINNVYKNYQNENFKNEINYNSFPKKDETIDFINLKYNDIFESYQAKTIKNLYQNLDFLLIIIKRFDKFIDKELITKSSNCQKLITIFNYYEHCIIRPLFYTINFLNEENFILIEKITSKELFKIFEVAINFYKYTIILYKKTSSIKEEYIEISKKLSELDLKVFSKIPLNIEMSSLFIKKLKSHIWDFKCEERKYYEFKKIISDLKESIIAIISISDINESSKELDISKEIKNLPNENFERIKLIYNKYNKKKEKTFDNDLSLIKALDYSVGNSKGRKIIIQYIKNKFTNILTYYDMIHLENCDIKISFRKDYKLQTIDISKYRYQNSYCIYYMNIILNNDSKACQNYISSSFSYDSTKNFIISVIKNFIFGNFLYQISKLNELDNTLEYKVNCRSNLSFELVTQYLKLLQNLCEGHNKEFQTVMFEINFLSSEDLKTNFDKNYKDFVARHSQLILYHKNRPKEKNESLLNFKKSQSDVVKTFKPVYSKSLSLTGITSKLGKENYDVSKEFPNEEEIDSDQEDIDYIITTFKKKKKVYDRDDNYLNANTQESEIKNEKFTQILPFKPLSFPNFIFLSMRIIFNNIKFNTNRNNEEIIEIYQKFNDLIVEIIQGTHSKNLDNFYRKLDDVILYDQKKKIMHFDNFIYFQFINLVYEIKEILYDFNIFESNSMINIKYNLFFILTNILNGENLNLETVKLFSKILDPKKLIELISKYLIIIYLKYNEKYQINDENFREKYLSLNLDMTIINRLHNEFKHNYDIFSDYIYRLSAQIYLYIKILGEKFDIIEANSILNLNNKDNQKVMDDLEENEKNKSSDFKKVHHSNESNHSQFPKNDLTEQKLVSIESLGCVNSFFKEMIKSCEFLIPFEDEDKVDEFDWECFDFIQDGSDDEDDDLISGINEDDKVEDISLIKDENASNDKTNENQENKPKEEQTLKKIYFIVDPKVYLISETNISYFFENADRSSSTNKLKYLLVSLEDFYTDLKYKLKLQEGNENMKILFKINYENVDYANLIFSMTIVLILLVFLNEESLNSWYLIVSVILLESIQVCMNLIFLLIFYHSKYNFYITKEKRKYNQVQLTNWEMLEIYLFKSFLFNDEVYLLILNVIFGILVILKPSFTMLFILQLLTIIKFLPTIKQIAEAFKIRISQLIMMVGFLFILIYFYSNISFFFYSKEFVMNSDSVIFIFI